MKNHHYNYNRLNVWIFILASFMLHSCGKWIVPPELVGQWKTDKHKITVRTKPEKMKFQFTSDSAIITLRINVDKTISGYIGSAAFENGKIKKNWGNPDKTGIAYIIECGFIGKIFDNDPLDTKKVEIWLGPLKRDIDAELRYTEGMAKFPMAGMIFMKEED